MGKALLKRLALLLGTLLLVSALAFAAFSIIPGALGKEDQIFLGDLACAIPNLMEGLDQE